MLERADEAEVGVGEARGGVGEAVVVEGVGAGVFHEGFEARSFCRRRVSNSDKREGGLGVSYNSAQRLIGRAMLAGRTSRARP